MVRGARRRSGRPGYSGVDSGQANPQLAHPLKLASADATEQSLRVLVVRQGGGGGIGRIELLLIEILRGLSTRRPLVFEAVARQPAQGRPASKIAFTLKVLARFAATRPDWAILAHVNHGALALAMPALRPSARQVFGVSGWAVWSGLSP